MSAVASSDLTVENEPFDIFGLWRRLLRYWVSIIACTVTVAGVAAALAFTAKPIYRAEITIAPSGQQGAQSALAGLADQVGSLLPMSLNLGRGGPSVEPLALLRSRALTEEFIRRGDLLPKLFPDRWDAVRKEWILEEGETPPTVRNGFAKFNSDVRRIDDETVMGLITMTIESTDRLVVADWANGLVELANEMSRRRSMEDAARRIEFLEAELTRTEGLEVRQAIYRVLEAEVKGKMLASVERDAAFKILDPAVTPDPAEYVKPKRMVIIGVGVWLGACIGVFIAFVRIALAERRRSATRQRALAQ